MLDLLTRPFVDLIAQHLGCAPAVVASLIGPPSRAEAGDLALPCFQLAKTAGLPPPRLAQDLAAQIKAAHPNVTVEAVGPFLNLRLEPAWVAARLLPCLDQDPLAPLRRPANGQTLVIDFSSPNIAKHLAFHHIRSTAIGNALALCYQAAGWKVVRINFLGDWGTAFGRLIAGWKREGLTPADLEQAEDPVGFLNALYVRISKTSETDPAVAAEARAWSKRLEVGDAEAKTLWQTFKDASLAEFRRIYDRLNISFDDWRGEAHYHDKLQSIVDELRNRGLLVEDQGAQVVDLRPVGMNKPCLILRSDGGTLYAARDLAACDDRHARYRFDRMIYEVDLGQSLHFREWFAVARLLGRPYADGLRHVGHGLVLMWNEEDQAWAKTATRRGIPMMLRDVLDEAVNRAQAIVAEKNPELTAEERAAVAEAVGVAAVVFNDLKAHRKGDVRFRFEEALSMQGDTGPYLQYTHARLCSIERKHRDHGSRPPADPARLTRPDEKQVLLVLCRLAPALQAVVDGDDPSQLATALLDLAGATSTWLTAGNREREARVLCDDPATAAARVALVSRIRALLAEGLRLLGLHAPDRM